MSWTSLYQILGHFHLVGLIIPELKDHMICFKLERSHCNALVENVIVKKICSPV